MKILSILFFVFALGLTQQLCVEAHSDKPHTEMVHNHVSFYGGQVGMSGDYHVELVLRENGEYRLYVSDFSRKPVDISKAKGTLIINPDSPQPEKLNLKIEPVLNEFLFAKGKSKKEGEEVYISASMQIEGKKPIFIEFIETIKNSGNVPAPARIE